MKIKITKNYLYSILFGLCVSVPYLSNYELTFAVWGFTFLVSVRKSYSLQIVKFISFFVAIFIIAFFSAMNKDFKWYDYFRDIAYLFKPIIGLLVGYQLCKKHISKPLNLLVYGGVIIAILHLIVVAYSLMFLNIRTMHNLRGHAGYFSDYEVYALIILIFHKKFQLDISRKKIKWFIGIIALSSFLYLARSNFIQFFILFMAIKGYFVLTKKSIIVVSTLILVSLASYAAIYAYNPNRGAKGFEAFLYKIKNAPVEAFKTKVDVNNWKDFNDNYRSYENILTVRQVTNKGTSSVLFGEGLGSSIDLKKKVWLQSSYMRYIPFLHNGYMTIFLKSGIFGVFILLLSIGFLFKNPTSENPIVKNINYLIVGTGVYLIVSYWVFMGLYFTVDTKSFIIAYLFAYRERLFK